MSELPCGHGSVLWNRMARCLVSSGRQMFHSNREIAGDCPVLLSYLVHNCRGLKVYGTSTISELWSRQAAMLCSKDVEVVPMATVKTK